MANQTMHKFGYPNSLVGEDDHWAVLLRPKQVTAGCLVLTCKEDATSLGAVSAIAGEHFPVIARRLEQCLSSVFKPDKYNYLALMMVDPHVHFHVIPRYNHVVDVFGTAVNDVGWPKHPDMQSVASLSDRQMEQMLNLLKCSW